MENQSKTHELIYMADLLSKEFCHFFTHILMRNPQVGDSQVPNALTVMHHEIVFETLQEKLWPFIEEQVGEELLPTYAYARLYSNGDVLEKHTDREACEVSVTIQLGRSHNYAWPIYVGDKRLDMAEGDGVIYPGTEVPHWRNVCDGPKDYYSGQVFLHYVRKNGPYADQYNDIIDDERRNMQIYIRNRTHLMDRK